MKEQVIPPYLECPERITFLCKPRTVAKEWFVDALSMDKLRYQVDGALRALILKGKTADIFVQSIKNPLTDVKDAQFYLSDHNNYHIGNRAGEHLTTSELLKLNLGNYRYYQDERYFLAIRMMYEECGKETYLLYISKKKPHPSEARAEQD